MEDWRLCRLEASKIMTSEEVKKIRGNLKMTQQHLAQILGVHPITVSKWERGRISVPHYHGTLLTSFKEAHQKFPNIGPAVVEALMSGGISSALYCLLSTAYKREKGETHER